jgi:hypothetical protein
MRNNPEVHQQMFEMIERWQQSRLSQKSFCQAESIKFNSFYYWYKRYRQQNQTPDGKSGFVKLKIEKPVSPASVEIQFPNFQMVRASFFMNPLVPII